MNFSELLNRMIGFIVMDILMSAVLLWLEFIKRVDYLMIKLFRLLNLHLEMFIRWISSRKIIRDLKLALMRILIYLIARLWDNTKWILWMMAITLWSHIIICGKNVLHRLHFITDLQDVEELKIKIIIFNNKKIKLLNFANFINTFLYK